MMEKQLSNGWHVTTLGAVCTDPQYGYTTKASDEGTIQLLRTTDITRGNIDWTTVPFCHENPTDPEKYLLKDGDIVISRAGSVGVSYLLKEPKKAVFASYLIRFKPLIDKKFFKYFLNSPYYWSQISKNSLGIAVQNVNASKLKEIEFSLPPLNEQKRIVAKIEELFSELDNGISALKTAQKQLKIYRQSILKHAFEGKLTAKWREENADKLETVEQLLTNIQNERNSHHQQQLAKGKDGKKTGKPKEPEQITSLSASEVQDLYQLPEGWAFLRLGSFIDKIEAGKSFKCDEREPTSGEIGVAKVSAVTWGEYNESESKTCLDATKVNPDSS